ncbi:MAG: saccharopine dehydrogenase NADP-binding domain-containing protein [Clostridiales bacterium]|nr:saccharopine dehydrogenase NADP-binding domain-containing protein [Clostridiales bacterium]
MKAFCLGGAGRICREAVFDLAASGEFDEIVVGDFDLGEAERVAEETNDERVRAVCIDVRNVAATASRLRGFDIAVDGTQISLNGLSTECIAKAGVNGVNLNGFGAEDMWHQVFKEAGKACVAGFGMTPGVTQMMAMDAAAGMDRVHEVYVSHGAFRPIAFSPAIAETTRVEYDPDYPARTVYEKGAFIHVPPFARPREVVLPKPYGKTVQYIIPHSETYTLAKALAPQGVKLIEVRGTWPVQNMDLIRGLYGYGILSNPAVEVDGVETGLMDIIGDYLLASEAGKTTALYGYALHVEVIGKKAGKRARTLYTHTHPASDGSVPEWAGLRAYTKNVGIPLAVAALLIARGELLPDPETGRPASGVLSPEEAFAPRRVFAELEKRGIKVHKK